jgi:hypothetical protein
MPVLHRLHLAFFMLEHLGQQPADHRGLTDQRQLRQALPITTQLCCRKARKAAAVALKRQLTLKGRINRLVQSHASDWTTLNLNPNPAHNTGKMDATALDLTTEAAWCTDALSVQNASNPSGVAHSFAALCEQMHQAGLSTSAIADHPAAVLFAAKLADLMGLDYHWPRHAEEKAMAVIRRHEAKTTTPS